MYPIFKRIFDFSLSLVFLLALSPLLLALALAIKLDSPGPVLFRQRRIGKGKREFLILKFRTMRTDAPKDTPTHLLADPSAYITPLGAFLRRTSLDELPQLFNILKGEMSLVGPRPERPEFTEKLASIIPFYNERHLVQPGLTGWAQIRYPYAASFDAAARKLQFDLYYIKNMSFLLDAAILLRTFKTILVGLRHDEEFLPVDDKLEEWLATNETPADNPQPDGETP